DDLEIGGVQRRVVAPGFSHSSDTGLDKFELGHVRRRAEPARPLEGLWFMCSVQMSSRSVLARDLRDLRRPRSLACTLRDDNLCSFPRYTSAENALNELSSAQPLARDQCVTC